MNIVFAKTRWHYDSYTEFWRLVEMSGFPVVYLDEMGLDLDVTYIFTPWNGEIEPLIQAKRAALTGPQRARVVWWNLERPDAPGTPPLHEAVTRALGSDRAEVTGSVSDIWVADRHYAALDRRLRHVPVASHPGLARVYGTTEPLSVECKEHRFDYAHISYLHGRRLGIHAALQRAGLKEAPNAWGAERDKVLRTSRVLVSTHQTPASIGEAFRFVLGAAYRMPLVAEHMADPWPLVAGVDYEDAAAERLPEVVAKLKADPERCRQLGNNLFKRLCEERTFRTEIEAAVKGAL